MTAADQRYYFDTNALQKFYLKFRIEQDEEGNWHICREPERGSLHIRRLVSSSPSPILLSPLTSIEFISKLMEYKRKRLIKRKEVRKLNRLLKHNTRFEDTGRRPFLEIPLPDDIFHLGENILLHHADTFDIGSNDALHLAIVKKLQPYFPKIIMVTSDNSMQKVCENIGILVYDPENME